VCRNCGLPFNTREIVEPEANNVEEAKRAVKDTLKNILPREFPEIPELPNPFL
jgi:hypothetical protein